MFERPGDEACGAEELAKWSVIKQTCQNDYGNNKKDKDIKCPVEEFEWIKKVIDINTKRKDKYEKDCKE